MGAFGRSIRKARIQNAMTQAELADKIGVTGATISNWETGKTEPTGVQRGQIQRVLGLTRGRLPRNQQDVGHSEGPSAFGSWLNRTRLERRLSVAELAEASGLSMPAIYNIEAGRITNPRSDTVRRLEETLGSQLSTEAKKAIEEDSTIKGLGQFKNFDPHSDDDFPAEPGIYVLYDVSDRPIYVGQGSSIKSRLQSHRDKFWYKSPIVEGAAYVRVEQRELREQIEKLFIKFLKSNAVINKQNVDR